MPLCPQPDAHHPSGPLALRLRGPANGEPVLPLPPAAACVQSAVRSLPRWNVESVDANASVVRVARRTRLWRFIDDITIRLEAIPTGTSRTRAARPASARPTWARTGATCCTVRHCCYSRAVMAA